MQWEGDKIIKVEFSRFVAYVLSQKFCHNGEGILSWAYVRSNEIKFSNKIEDNKMLVVEIEDGRRIRFIV